jgi:hypothetical protein
MENRHVERRRPVHSASCSITGKLFSFERFRQLSLSSHRRCDSISTVFVSLAACCASGMGNYPSLMLLNGATAVTLFYIAHWSTYITGTLQFGKFDVTEAQCCIMMIHLLTFFFGVDVWQSKILGFQLWALMATFSLCTAFLVVVNFCRTFAKGKFVSQNLNFTKQKLIKF